MVPVTAADGPGTVVRGRWELGGSVRSWSGREGVEGVPWLGLSPPGPGAVREGSFLLPA